MPQILDQHGNPIQREVLEGTLTRDLLYPMAVLNFGQVDPRRLPRLEFDTRKPEDLKLYADALPNLVGLGVKVPVKWVHDKLAIPQAQEDEEVLTAPRPEMALPPELRPVPKPTQTAAASLQYRAVLTNAQGEVVYPDQATLDAAADNLPADEINTGMEQLLAPVIQAIRDGATPDDALEALVAAYPDMDDSAIAGLLARAIFVADVWGRLNGHA